MSEKDYFSKYVQALTTGHVVLGTTNVHYIYPPGIHREECNQLRDNPWPDDIIDKWFLLSGQQSSAHSHQGKKMSESHEHTHAAYGQERVISFHKMGGVPQSTKYTSQGTISQL